MQYTCTHHMVSLCGIPQIYIVFTIWNCKNLGGIVADVCKIIVSLGETFIDKIKIFKISD
jgi:hypothetical protein